MIKQSKVRTTRTSITNIVNKMRYENRLVVEKIKNVVILLTINFFLILLRKGGEGRRYGPLSLSVVIDRCFNIYIYILRTRYFEGRERETVNKIEDRFRRKQLH